MAERLAGNAGEGNPEGQKVIDSGTGGKAGGFDSDIDEKAKSVGPALPAAVAVTLNCTKAKFPKSTYRLTLFVLVIFPFWYSCGVHVLSKTRSGSRGEGRRAPVCGNFNISKHRRERKLRRERKRRALSTRAMIIRRGNSERPDLVNVR